MAWGGDALSCAGGGLAEAVNVGGATALEGRKAGLNAAEEVVGFVAGCIVAEVLGGDDGGRDGGEDDSETHFDWGLVV